MHKQTILFLIFHLFVSSLHAQNISIKGNITDSKEKAAIPYANITLLLTDSSFVAGTTSDEGGKFTLYNIDKGNYILTVSCIGYPNCITQLNNLSKDIDLGVIVLEELPVELQGITITASQVITKLDRQIVLPTRSQIQNSTSGYELLSKMMLPGLKIDLLQNVVSTIGGETVQLRINDMKATAPQVHALRPGNVVRVEYIDNPGIRYADEGISAVINFIVRQHTSGISAGVNLTNSFTTGFGNDNIYIKANHKQSEFGLNYYMTYRDYNDRFTNDDQSFLLKDGSSRNRRLEGISLPFNYTTHDVEFSYNLFQPDDYTFNAVFRNSIFNAPKRDVAQNIVENNIPKGHSYNKMTDKSNTPAIDLYFMKHLPHKQSITANIVGTFIGSDYSRNYKEYFSDINNPHSNYAYSADGNKYSLIGEGIYEKEFKPFELSLGLQYTQAHTKNIYEGTTDAITRMNTSNTYAYTQIQGKIKELSYMLGVGVSRQAFDENDEGFVFYTFRPSFMVSYPVFKGANLRYIFNVQPTLPSLSNLSDIRQQMNDFEVNTGNPDLTPYRTYTNQLRFQYQYKQINTQLSGNYSYLKNPIMEEVNRIDLPDTYLFEYRYDNQKSSRCIGGQGYIQMQVIENILSLSGYTGINYFRNTGNKYDHSYTTWYAGGQAEISYKKWSIGGWIYSRYNSLNGETIRYGENNCGINMGYKINKEIKIGAGLWYPFISEGWSAGSKRISGIAKKETRTYIKDNGNMLTLSFTWNIHYGRKHKAENKTLNNADQDSGIVK